MPRDKKEAFCAGKNAKKAYLCHFGKNKWDMHRIFIPIYHYFQGHKAVMYTILALTSVVFLFFGVQVRYEENISRLLPSSSVESELAFSSIGLKDKIFIQITSASPDSPLSPAELAGRTDEFIEFLQGKDPDGKYIDNILWKMEPEMALGALDFVLGHIPSFVDTSAYAGFDRALQPDNARAQMQEDYRLVMEDMTGDVTQGVAYDPLNLREVVLGDLLDGAVGSFNIVEGHFFCPDSTVTMSYLAPAFLSLDSWAARDFAKVLRGAAKQFTAEHPDVAVHAHGDPMGSVSNAGRIRSDLFLTVGISIFLILLLLGVFFKSISFLWKLLLPIAYGTAFSLCCVYLLKGGMSLMALGLGAIVLGVAMSYCLHILIHHAYVGDREKLLRDESTPVFLGCLTTVGAFSSLIFTDSELLRDFGIFASLALVGSTLFTLVFLPHFLPDSKGKVDGKAFEVIGKITGMPLDRSKWFIAAFTLIIAIGVAFSHKVKFDSDLRHLDYNAPEEIAAEALYNEKNNDGFMHQYFATVSTDPDEAIGSNMLLMGKLDSLKGRNLVHGYGDIVPKLFIPTDIQEERIGAWNSYWTEGKKQYAMNLVRSEAVGAGLPPEMFDLFEGLLYAPYESASLLESEVVPKNLLGNFIEKNADGQYMVFTDVSMTPEDKDEVTAALVANPRTFVLDPFYYCKDMVEVIHDDFNIAVWFSSLFVLIILIISFRNILTALLSFLPMVLSWFMVQGYMALFGLEFNLINIVISTFIFGIGVDYSIFMTEGLLAQARTGQDNVLDYHKVAIFFSAAILVIVTGSLLFAKHPAISSIGLCALIGMASTIMISYSLQPFAFKQLMRIPSYRKSVLSKRPYGQDKQD